MTATGLLKTSKESEEQFETGSVLTIVGGHFVHDTFTAFVAPLLPLVIEKLSLTLTLAGTLTAMMQLPAILNPFIGYLADKISLRFFVIFAPAVTATLIGLMGLAPSYLTLSILFVLIGIAVAAFHAPTPAMIAHMRPERRRSARRPATTACCPTSTSATISSMTFIPSSNGSICAAPAI